MAKSIIPEIPALDNVILTEKIIQSASIQHRHNYYSLPKHIHNNIEIYQLIQGECKMDIGNDVISCKCNDFIMILPNVSHSIYLTSKDTCSFKHIHFNPKEFATLSLEKIVGYPMDLLTTLLFCCNSFFHTQADERISSILTGIISTFRKDSMLACAYTNLHLTELLLYIIEITGKDLSSYTQKHSDQNRYVTFTLNFIQENYTSKIKIQEIAKQLNISSRYLSKIFFEHMNMTILSYINTYRMNQAIELIANTDLTMTEIAEKIGMNDSQHFSKLFKNTIGSPPNEYRKILNDSDFYT